MRLCRIYFSYPGLHAELDERQALRANDRRFVHYKKLPEVPARLGAEKESGTL